MGQDALGREDQLFDFLIKTRQSKRSKMADAAAPKKRGRPAKSTTESKEKTEEKKAEKRPAAPAADGESPAKRGRGRPKGSGKKAGGSSSKPSAKGSSGRGRGRPKKSEAASKKDESAEDEESAADEDGESSWRLNAKQTKDKTTRLKEGVHDDGIPKFFFFFFFKKNLFFFSRSNICAMHFLRAHISHRFLLNSITVPVPYLLPPLPPPTLLIVMRR